MAAQARGVHKALPSPTAPSASSQCPQASPPSPVECGYAVQSIILLRYHYRILAGKLQQQCLLVFLLLMAGIGKEEKKSKG